MKLETAKLLLNECERDELNDHAFGDCEVWWFKDGREIASGYFGGGRGDVYLTPHTRFEGDEARELMTCGKLRHVERNDETGPDNFELGKVMPGLTKEAVLHEITQH